MKKRLAAAGTLAVAALALWLGAGPVSAADGRMPEFTRQTADAWLNTAPLKAADFRGKVVLLEVYASG